MTRPESDRPDHHDVEMLLGDLQRDGARTAYLERQAALWVRRLAARPWTPAVRDTLDALGLITPGSVGVTERVLARLAELKARFDDPEGQDPATPDDRAESVWLHWGLERRRALALARLDRGAYTPRARAYGVSDVACRVTYAADEGDLDLIETAGAGTSPQTLEVARRSQVFRDVLIELCVERERDEAPA
jgi:hypothetical protein